MRIRSKMEPGDANSLLYERSHFVTRLPTHLLYSPSHCWLCEQNGLWRIGLTSFATRLLGAIVDYGFDLQPETSVRIGQIIGWVEGLKSVSDLSSVVSGKFVRSNPQISQDPELVDRDSYGEGWLYETSGTPGDFCVNAQGYCVILDATIDKLLEKQRAES